MESCYLFFSFVFVYIEYPHCLTINDNYFKSIAAGLQIEMRAVHTRLLKTYEMPSNKWNYVVIETIESFTQRYLLYLNTLMVD